MRKPGTAVQHTIKAPIHCIGVGLHLGLPVRLELKPAAIDTGIVFRRVDLAEPVEIRAVWSNAVESPLCSTVTDGKGVSVSTIEHLMAALHANAIDNVVVELDGPEVPILDGSAEPFMFLIGCAGPMAQMAERRAIEIRRTIRVESGAAWIEVEPDSLLSIDCTIDFASRAIGRQSMDTMVEAASFRTEIGHARTFGFLKEVEQLRAAGLARGGSIANAIVLDGDKILNPEGLRYVDEFVRHKTLDLIGDLYMAGHPLLGRVRAHRPSHALTCRLLNAIFADASAWQFESNAVEAHHETSLAWIEPATALSA